MKHKACPGMLVHSGVSSGVDLINPYKEYSVGAAATAAGVHADTIRRWTNQKPGSRFYLRSTRTLGGNRRITGVDLIEALNRTNDAENRVSNGPVGDPVVDVANLLQASDEWRAWRVGQVRTEDLEMIVREVPYLEGRLVALRQAAIEGLQNRGR